MRRPYREHFQSHVRPIVRGKSKSPTEFGAKIGASIVNGYTFIDHHSWDAYNESTDLTHQIELYRQRFGFLPTKIYADKIYMNKENRKLMKELEIQSMGKPLGRPPKGPKNISLKWLRQWEREMKSKLLLVPERESTELIMLEQSYLKRLTLGRLCAISSKTS